jgi:quinoprotein glucose dehydrogenase
MIRTAFFDLAQRPFGLCALHVCFLIVPLAFAQQTDWPSYGGDPGNTRYSTLKQINTMNASKLAPAWTFDTRPDPSVKSNRQNETTPLVVNGVLYVLTSFNSLAALDAVTGKPVWLYKYNHEGRPPRGVAYWPGDKDNPARILLGTFDGFLVAVDAKSGKIIDSFGTHGEIDLKAGMKDPVKYPRSHYGLSSAPMIYKNVVITGSHTQDAPSLGPPGDARGWDTRTGKLLWQFHSVPKPGEVGHETWLNDGWKERSGANAWTTGSVDTKTGTVFLCFDSPATDLSGGDRPGNNLFGNTLVALDAETGKLKWYFQTTHHDIWDYDEPGSPLLTDVTVNGKTIPAVIEVGKTGLVFELDRRTGKPILPVEERPVPKGDVPGEWYSPTEPFPVKTPPLTRMSITRDQLAKVTPEQQKFCENLWDAEGGAHNDGPYTPMGMKPTVVFPGADGGGNWGGITVDPKLGFIFQNVKNDGAIGRMDKPQGRGGRDGLGQDIDPNMYARTPVVVGGRRVSAFTNPNTGWPCEAPPWGELSAVNISTGEVAWRVPFGRVDDLEAKGVMNTGNFNKGGSVATAGGVLFIGATYDPRFHVYDSKTGKLLWEAKLDAPAEANPVTYMGKNGKQYVVVNADYYVAAFALP